MSEIINRFTKVLPCKLSDEELGEKAKEIADVYTEIDALEDEKKVRASEYTEKINERSRAMAELIEQVKTRSAPRPVECITRANDRLGEVDEVRTDTGEVIETRPMGEDERQRDMFNGSAEASA